MMFGGEGSPKPCSISRGVSNAGSWICRSSRSAAKGKRLEAACAMPRRIRMHVEGFTREVPRFMRLADFFIGKPGPGSISEAVAMGLPVIVECNHWTLPQERYNAEMGAGAGCRHRTAQFPARYRSGRAPDG
jgi:1,2-diacylglycerol 3-beta-galactosyltransferase